MKKIHLLLLMLAVPITLLAQTTSYVISGTILDAQTDEPLTGANVIILGHTFGASADLDGNFQFSANLEPGTYRLQISFIGYNRVTTDLELGSETNIELGELTLRADILGTEEIVVTGASGLTDRRQLGNSISTVSAEAIAFSGASSVDRALSGRVAGALVQQNSGNPAGGISIRLRGTSTLLGSADPLYIVDGMIMNNDSPELLSLGGYSQNRLVDLNPNDIERIEIVKGAAAAALYGSRANNGVVQIFTRRGQSGAPRITYSSRFNVDQIRNTLLVNQAPIDAAGNPVERFDAQNDIFRTAVGNDQFLSIAGGQGNSRYYLSGSLFNNQGIVQNTEFTRATTRLNLDQELAPWLTLAVGLNYTFSESQEIPNGGLNDDYGALTGFIFGPNTINPQPDPQSGVFPGGFVLANPLEVINRYDIAQRVNRVGGNARLTALPMEGLSLEYTLGVDNYSQVATFFIPPGTTAPGLGDGFARRAEREFLQFNNDFNIRYRTSLNPSIESTTMIGGTIQYEDFSTIGLESREFSPFISVVTGGGNFAQPGESRGERVIYGAFAQQTLGISGRYFLTAAGRFDASSSFGVDNRWQFYPKFSASYILSEEDFWRGPLERAINSLTLRASVGQSGGLTAIGPFDRFTRFAPTSVNGRSALVPAAQLGAIDIRPERQTEVEAGFDASFLNNRASVQFTWYNQRTEDLLLTRSVAPSTGFDSRLGNFGELTNRGIEIMVQAIPVLTQQTQWTSSLTFSQNRNEINGIENDVLILGSSFGQSAAVNGQPLGVFYSSAFERDGSGNIVFNENGIPQRAASNQVIGDPNPDFSGAFINEVQHQRWNFRMQWDFVYGNDVFNFTRRLAALGAFGTLDDPFGRELRGELPSGYSAAVFNIFENWVEDGSYLKLRELSVSYTTHPQFWGLQSVRFSLIGRNLLSIDNYSGYDPEINTAGQRTAVRGFDFVEVPIPRSVLFGVTANF